MEDTRLTKFDRSTAGVRIAEILREEIRRGVLPSGSHLGQVDIAARFGVSSTPVREALAILQATGSIDRRMGAAVVRSVEEDVSELRQIQEALEGLALEKAIPKLTEPMLEELQSLVCLMSCASSQEELDQICNQFFTRLYLASGKRRLCKMISDLRDSFKIANSKSFQQTPKQAAQRYQEMLDSCRRVDLSRAQRARRSTMEES